MRRFPSALEVLVSSIAILRLLSLCCVGFCCLYSKEACGCVCPKRLCSELRGLPPLSLVIAFGSVPWQEMRDLFYLAWTTLFLPDYWCYFTLNNMTLCSASAQGQNLRVIDIFKGREGEYNQREEWAERGKKSSDAKATLAAGLNFQAGLKWNRFWRAKRVFFFSPSRCYQFKMTLWSNLGLKFKFSFKRKHELSGRRVYKAY